jgi:AraC-like DNA-binding protein
MHRGRSRRGSVLLTELGTSLSSLLDEDRRERALLMLRTTDLSIAEIGDRLGYHNTQNFERAFRRWTATTPTTYRRS